MVCFLHDSPSTPSPSSKNEICHIAFMVHTAQDHHSYDSCPRCAEHSCQWFVLAQTVTGHSGLCICSQSSCLLCWGHQKWICLHCPSVTNWFDRIFYHNRCPFIQTHNFSNWWYGNAEKKTFRSSCQHSPDCQTRRHQGGIGDLAKIL